MLSFGQDASHALGVVVLLVLLLFIILWVAPWVTFWAIGVLFDYHISLTWLNWFAYWVLYMFTFYKPVNTSR